MLHRRLSAVSLMTLAALMAVDSSAQTVASTRPKAPQHLCVNNICPPAVSSTTVKFHPGHYVWFDTPRFDNAITAINQSIAELVADKNIAGVQIYGVWADFEGPTQGDYSPGVNKINTVLNLLKSQSRQLRLMVVLQEKSFTGGGSDTSMWPQYAINAGYILSPSGPQSGGLKSLMDWSNPKAVSALAALGAYYGDKFNKEPLFEMFSPMGETTVSGALVPVATQLATIRPFLAQVVTHWPNTLVRLEANWFANGPADLASLYAWMRTNYPGRFSIGGPDPEPAAIAAYGGPGIHADLAFRGQDGGGPDLRGVMPWVGEVQEFGLGASGATIAPNTLYQYWMSMKANHVVWNYENWLTYKWSDEKAVIDANHTDPPLPSQGTWNTN